MISSSNKISNVVPGESIEMFETSISYHGMLDSNIVHSHHEKMKWSKARHSELYDPTLEDPFQYMEEGEEGIDMKRRPTLAYTLIQRLSNYVFASLISKLPTEEARNVMSWKDANAISDLNPQCEIRPHGGDEKSFESITDPEEARVSRLKQEQDHEHRCRVEFSSLVPFFGISFNMTLIIRTKPMSNLNLKDVIDRTTPDDKGWTQPISSSDIRVNLKLSSPNYAPQESMTGRFAGNGREKSRSMIEIDEANVEEAVELLLQKSKNIFGGAKPRIHQRDNVASSIQMIEHSFPIYEKRERLIERGSESNATVDLRKRKQNTVSEINPDILELCEKYGLLDAECLQVQKKVLAEEGTLVTNEALEINDHLTEADFKMMDQLTADTIAEELGLPLGEWELPLDELMESRQDMLSLNKLIEDAEESIMMER
jgi:hypothetical protein